MPMLSKFKKLKDAISLVRSSREATTAHHKSDIDDMQMHHQEWVELGNNGQFHEAIQLCLATIDNPKDNYWSSSFLGYAYYQLTDYDSAIEYLEIAFEKDPGNYYVTYFLACSFHAVGRKTEALNLYTVCIEKYPEHAEEVLDRAIPLAVEIREQAASEAFLSALQFLLDRGLVPSTIEEKLLCFLRRDSELKEQINRRVLSGADGA